MTFAKPQHHFQFSTQSCKNGFPRLFNHDGTPGMTKRIFTALLLLAAVDVQAVDYYWTCGVQSSYVKCEGIQYPDPQTGCADTLEPAVEYFFYSMSIKSPITLDEYGNPTVACTDDHWDPYHYLRVPFTRYGDSCPALAVYDEDTGICVGPHQDSPDGNTVANKGACETCNGTNPINGATGNKYQRETDYTSSVVNGLRFERHYNSEAADLKPGIAGDHWRSTYDRNIELTYERTIGDIVAVNYRPDGQGVFFVENASVWTPTIDLTLQLIELKDGQGVRTGWELTGSNDTVEAYDVDGKLISLSNLAGFTQTLDYALTSAQGGDDNPGTLDKVTGPFGRTLSISYDVNARLATLTDPAGEIVSYVYDANNNLSTVTYPDETPADSNDNPTRIYHYEDVNFIHALTGITDESGNRFASWGYDIQGRAIFSEHAGGTERADVVYNVDGTTSITNSLGQLRTYHYETHNSVHRTSQIDGDQCVSCGGSTKSTTYDANGFVDSRTDFNGNVTTFINDTRGLQTSRTEAVGTAEERTITTEWHPDFRLPTKITEPGRITEFIYDPQGRLLSRKVSAP